MNILKNANMSSCWQLLLVGMLTLSCSLVATQGAYNSLLPIDALRIEYINLEKALWQYLEKPGVSKEAQMAKVYDSHRKFMQTQLPNQRFESNKFDILNHYEWSLLERDLLTIDGIYEFVQVVC